MIPAKLYGWKRGLQWSERERAIGASLTGFCLIKNSYEAINFPAPAYRGKPGKPSIAERQR